MFKRVFTFLRLLDFDGGLSLTNIGVIVAIVKLAASPSLSVQDTGVFLVAILNYAHKRTTNQAASTQSDTSAAVEKATALEAQFSEGIAKLTTFQASIDDVKARLSRYGISTGVSRNGEPSKL